MDRRSAAVSVCLVAALALGHRARAAESTAGAARPPDPIEQARGWAVSGRRADAIRVLRERLASHPGDGDARLLLGIYLSWEGQAHYDESRACLRTVLARNPGHGDALPALMNIELWDGHPERAEALGRAATTAQAQVIPALFVAQARALAAMNRVHDARPLVDRVLAVDPADEGALALKRRLDERTHVFELSTGLYTDWFDDGTRPWREHTLLLERETPYGSVTARVSRAYRFDKSDNLFELEAYPRLRSGTYAFVNVGAAHHRTLYAKLRLLGDIYQTLGLGFEAALGVRHLRFTEPVNVYVGALSKYWGSWLFTARTFVAPRDHDVSVSTHASARRYFGGEGTSYLGLRYARGLSREIRTAGDADLLDSNTLALDAVIWLGQRVELTASFTASLSERINRADLQQYSTGTSLGWAF